ncbi:DUF6193 family natural product biosynthesis protein [Streptomyces anulatus]
MVRAVPNGHRTGHWGTAAVGEADTAEEAVGLVASRLPAGCGPAVDGTPDVLEPLS